MCFIDYSIVVLCKTTRLPALHLGSDYSCEQRALEIDLIVSL